MLSLNDKQRISALRFPCRCAAALLFAFFALFFSNPGYTADTSVKITLTPETQSVNIGSSSTILTDASNKTPLNTLISVYKKNVKNTSSQGDIINLSHATGSVILFIPVSNKSSQTDWILDFGEITDGRFGHVQDIIVINTGNEKAFSAKSTEPIFYNEKQIIPENSNFYNSSVLISLKPNAENLLAVTITPAPGLPLVLSPRILSEKNYLQELSHGRFQNVLKNILYIFVLFTFSGLFFISKSVQYLPFIGLYLFSAAFAYLSDTFFISNIPLQNLFLMLCAAGTPLSALLLTRIFCKISHEDHPSENMVLIISGLMMILAVFISFFLAGSSTGGYMIFSGVYILCLIVSIVFTAFIRPHNQVITIIFCAAWAVDLIGFSVTSLALCNIIPADHFKLNAHLISLLPQSILFIAAGLHEYKETKKITVLTQMRERKEEQNLARLQKSKESADQARLLRVIERERELMNELRDREAKRTEEMRIAKDAADRANQAKSAFLAVVSHEIRTPMTGILGMVELMKDTHLTNTQSDYISTIRKSGDTMMALLNDILDFEKIEHGSMELEKISFDLYQLVKDIEILMSGHAAKKGLELKTEINPEVPHFVIGDPTRLRQVLLNLVNNGMKFTEQGSVKIKVSPAESDTLLSKTFPILFEVIDTGIGISEKAKEKLFTPFAQAESGTSRKYGGTGLGLAISNRLIEAMNSKILVDSEEGQGSKFHFTINLPTGDSSASAEESEKTAQNVKSLGTRSMKILVTEDNEMNRKVLYGLLNKEGHAVLLAANGMEAVKIALHDRPDLILMDIEMDGMNGVDTTLKIRAHQDPVVARIPIIALTGNVRLEDIELYFESQMNGFISKPIDPNKLAQVIHNAAAGKLENPLPPIAATEKKQPADPFLNMKTDLTLDERETFTHEEQPAPTTIIPSTISVQDFIVKKPILIPTKIPDTKNTHTENPVTKIHTHIGRPTPGAKETNFMINDKKPEEMSEIQRYLMQQNENYKEHAEHTPSRHSNPEPMKETPSIASPVPAENHPVESISESADVKISDFIDTSMLDSLLKTLGEMQFTSLMGGFIEKAEEIIAAIEGCAKSENIASLGARAHELKGMAGNFGMKKVSEIAGNIEKTAKTSQAQTAFAQAQTLNAAHVKTKAAFEKWTKK